MNHLYCELDVEKRAAFALEQHRVREPVEDEEGDELGDIEPR